MPVIVGGSFTGMTVTVKVVLVLTTPSLTVRVIVTGPPISGPLFSLGAGITVTVRPAPLPPRTMLAVGTRIGSEEAAVTVKLAAGVSISPMVKGSAAVLVSSLIV